MIILYYSTDAVFPAGLKDCKETDDAGSYHSQLHDGYSQTKWVAEQIVQRAGHRGIPVTIYRLGTYIMHFLKNINLLRPRLFR
jgi:thioester reductase-like protein